MTSKPVAVLLSDLKIGRTHSRPQVSNDNSFSEAAFKALKYCPSFPERFGSLADARSFCDEFFNHSNHQRLHAGIGYVCPNDEHEGRGQAIRQARRDGLAVADQARRASRRGLS